MKGTWIAWCAAAAIVPIAGFALAAENTAPAVHLDERHRDFLARHCLACHGEDRTEGGVPLHSLAFSLDTPAVADVWQKVLNVVNAGEMPPADAAQPETVATTDFLASLSDTLARARRAIADSGGLTVVRRLNRREYANTIRDLLGVEVDVRDLPADSGSGTFDTVGASLFMSSDQLEQYLALGRQAIQEAFAVHAEKIPRRTIHHEAEEAANVQIRGARDIITAKSEPARRWYAAVDDAAAKAPNGRGAAAIRGREEVKGDPRRFYRFWNEIDGAPAPADFGLKDAGEAEMAQGEYDAIHAYQERYLALPRSSEGSYLFVFRLRPQEGITPPAGLKPGRYVFRFRIAAVDGTPQRRRFVEVGRPSVPGAFDVLSTHEITGTPDAPQVVEVPVTLTSADRREFAVREKRLNSREQEVALWVLHEKKHKDWLPPSMWIDWLELEGPLPQDTVPDFVRERPAREVLEAFAIRAFRGHRPEAEFLDGLVRLHDERRATGASYAEAIREPLGVILAAPGFLYLSEPSSPGPPRPLGREELATRLAYFLWSGPPDDELLAADLRAPDVLAAQVERMIAAPRIRGFVEGFVHQWLSLERLDFFQFNDRDFPEFDDSLKAAARNEVYETFAHLLRTGGGLGRLLSSDEVVVNGLLGQFYGLEGVHGDAWRPVALPARSPRGGLLGMAAIMAMGSNGERSSPVERGAWVLRKLLHAPPPPAPPNVPQLSRLADRPLSPRERVIAHQEEPQCAQCHRRIDPIGFGLENFDAIGRWRTTETYLKRPGGRQPWPIDASGRFHDGPAFADFYELRALIAARSIDFGRGFAEALIEYALGRPCGFTETPLVDTLVEQAATEDLSVRRFIHALVQSHVFQSK